MALFAQLVGSAFRDKSDREHLLTLSVGDQLVLLRDEHNQFDPNAIRVHHSTYFLGFVERQMAAELAPKIDAGERFRAVIKRADDPKKPLLEIFPV